MMKLIYRCSFVALFAFAALLASCSKDNDDIKSTPKEEQKEPDPIAKGMSFIKTNVKMGIDESDKTVANLITDGCNMGIKSLNKYLNQYAMADVISKKITEKLIRLEENLRKELSTYL